MPIDQLFYTDRPRGKGVNPAASGYQVQACSSGIKAAEQRLLDSICMHYGNTVYGHAPRAARDAETAWRKQATDLKAVPPNVLGEFPFIWSFDQSAGGRFALTRVCYRGITHDGRFGNFFAHALVFSPDALAGCGFNPLQLARQSGLFRTEAEGESISLEPLPGLPSQPDTQNDCRFLRDNVSHLPALITALSAAQSQPIPSPASATNAPPASTAPTPAARPVLIGLRDWREGPAVVEALLNLLPPHARSRTTFSTYESDRRKQWPTEGAPRPVQAAAHQLIVQCPTEAQPLALRPDELQLTFAVFNFVEQQFSPADSPTRYAEFATECFKQNRLLRLQQHHQLTEALALGGTPAAWDQLVSAADLANAKLPTSELLEAARALATVCTESRQAAEALARLGPHVERLSEANDFAGLSPLAASVVKLLGLMEGGAALAEMPFIVQMRKLARRALAAGRARLLDTLMQHCGPARGAVLRSLLIEALPAATSDFPLPAESTERQGLLQLLVEVLPPAEQAAPTELPRLLVATFRFALNAKLSAMLWPSVASLVQSRLSGKWDDSKIQLVKDLAPHMPAEACADGFVCLQLRLLDANKVQGSALNAPLEQIARACSACVDPEASGAEALQFAQNALQASSQAEPRAEAFGRMAGAAGNSTCYARFRTACEEEVAKLGKEAQARLRQRLLQAGAVNVLCDLLLNEVLPTQKALSSERFDQWAKLLGDSPPLLDAVCGATAARLEKAASTESAQRLAETVLKKYKDKVSPKLFGASKLYQALILTLPMAPLEERWKLVLGSADDHLDGQALARLRMVRFMRGVEEASGQAGWRPADFPRGEPAWNEDLPRLSLDDRTAATNWAVGLLHDVGINSTGDAEGLIAVLAPAGRHSPDDVADVVTQLLRDRGEVAAVLVAAHFADCALKGADSGASSWVTCFQKIVQRLDKNTRALLAEYLANRFGRWPKDYHQRLNELAEAAGLGRIKSAFAPVAPGTNDGARAGAGALVDTAREKARQLLGGIKGLFGHGADSGKPRDKDQ